MIKWILVSQWIIDDRDCYTAVIATLSKGITIFDREPSTPATPAEPVNVEKKKRRDTSFQPTKQLFQLPPRVNKHNNHNQNHDSNNASTTPSTVRHTSSAHKKEEMAVRMAAEYCMSQFVNQLGRFSLPNERSLGSCRSAMEDDVRQLKEFRELQKHDSSLADHASSIRYFLIDRKTLLAIIDVTDKVQKPGMPKNIPSVVAVIRDTTGKYVWSMETQYKDPAAPVSTTSTPLDSPLSNSGSGNGSGFLKPPKQESFYTEKPVTVPTAIAVNEKEMPTMDKIFVPQSKEWEEWESVKKLMQLQEKSELLHMKSCENNYLQKYQLSSEGPKIDNRSPRGFRLLLAQIGFLLPQNRKHITPLHITDSIISEMETLDMLNE